MAAQGIAVTGKERRTALVLGNLDYKFGPMKNTLNDAEDIAQVLRRTGFDVTLLLNANQERMDDGIS